MADEMAVLMAAYTDRQLVENEWNALRAMINDGVVDLDDAAVIENIGGKVGIIHNLHHPIRKGMLVGAVMVVLGPIGLVAGAAGGVVGGKAADIMRDGLSRKALEELGSTLTEHELLIVLTGRPDVVKAMGDTMTEANRLVIHLVSEGAEDLRALEPEG